MHKLLRDTAHVDTGAPQTPLSVQGCGLHIVQASHSGTFYCSLLHGVCVCVVVRLYLTEST